jgi:hypothetical protein
MEAGGDPGAVFALMRGLELSWLGVAVRTSTWIYPLASVLHIVGLAALLGVIAVLDLRLLGVARSLPAPPLLDFLLPIARGAFAVQVVTGATMFASDASHLYDNPFFIAKLALVGLALANVVLFHARLRAAPSPVQWTETSPGVRIGAAISLLAWTGVAICGRMIAYV